MEESAQGTAGAGCVVKPLLLPRPCSSVIRDMGIVIHGTPLPHPLDCAGIPRVTGRPGLGQSRDRNLGPDHTLQVTFMLSILHLHSSCPLTWSCLRRLSKHTVSQCTRGKGKTTVLLNHTDQPTPGEQPIGAYGRRHGGLHAHCSGPQRPPSGPHMCVFFKAPLSLHLPRCLYLPATQWERAKGEAGTHNWDSRLWKTTEPKGWEGHSREAALWDNSRHPGAPRPAPVSRGCEIHTGLPGLSQSARPASASL